MNIQTSPGYPSPFGATVTPEGVNFAIFSRHATRVWLHLFNEPADDRPSHTFELDPLTHRTGDVWHIHLAGLGHARAVGEDEDARRCAGGSGGRAGGGGGGAREALRAASPSCRM